MKSYLHCGNAINEMNIMKQEEMSMTITKTQSESFLNLTLEGRLDTTTAPELEAVLQSSLGDVTELVLDFGQLVYLSSAGLRVILSAQKRMNAQGKMVIRQVNDTIMEVFEITGFADILTIED